MLTAMLGAAINVILNFVLIPDHGAMGAAVATLISYGAVFVVRAYDTRHYLKFSLHIPRVVVNTVLLGVQIVIMVSAFRYWQYAQIALVIFFLIFNGRSLVVTVWRFIGGFFEKKRKKCKKLLEK